MEGLIPVASTTKNGLMEKELLVRNNIIALKQNEFLRVYRGDPYARLSMAIIASVNLTATMGFVTFFPGQTNIKPLFNLESNNKSIKMYYRSFDGKHEYLINNTDKNDAYISWRIFIHTTVSGEYNYKFDIVEANVEELTLIDGFGIQ